MKSDKNIKIDLPNGSTLELSEESFDAVAGFVRKQDRLQYAHDVLCNNLSCSDSKMENLEEYIVSDEARLSAFADALYARLESGQGEKEYFAVDEMVQQYETAVYRIISNKGTNEEQEDEAVLPKELAEKLPVQDDLTIWSTDGEYLDSAYINEVVFIGPYEHC